MFVHAVVEANRPLAERVMLDGTKSSVYGLEAIVHGIRRETQMNEAGMPKEERLLFMEAGEVVRVRSEPNTN